MNNRTKSIEIMRHMQFLVKFDVITSKQAATVVSAYQKDNKTPLEQLLVSTDFPETMYGTVAELREFL